MSAGNTGLAFCSARLQAGMRLNTKWPDHVGALQKPFTHELPAGTSYVPAYSPSITFA
jgi:hypothetical protein